MYANASIEELCIAMIRLVKTLYEPKISNKDALSPPQIHGDFPWPWTSNKKAPLVPLSAQEFLEELKKAQGITRDSLSCAQKYKIQVAYNRWKVEQKKMGHELPLDTIEVILENLCQPPQPPKNDAIPSETEYLSEDGKLLDKVDMSHFHGFHTPRAKGSPLEEFVPDPDPSSTPFYTPSTNVSPEHERKVPMSFFSCARDPLCGPAWYGLSPCAC